MNQDRGFALVLGGGNALGSYHAGVYQALHEADREPRWIVGSSIGAITGALIAGNPPADRLAALTDFWRPGRETPWDFEAADTMRRTVAAAATLAGGQPGVFDPAGPFGSWWYPDPGAAAPSFFDTKPLGATLARLVDFDRLNAGDTRLTIAAVDLESGEEVVFDTARERLTAEHVRASAALLPTFPPIEIDGRALVDGGLSANVPLDPVLSAPPAPDTLCIAVDLLPLSRARPRTLGEAAARAQDLIFAAQTRRTIERWQAAYATDERLRSTSVTLARLAYHDQSREVAGKAMDFSPLSIRERWDAGLRDARRLLARLDSGELATGKPGLAVTAPSLD